MYPCSYITLIKGGHGFAWSCCCLIPRCPSYYMMVRLALWDRCTAAGGGLHPSLNTPRSLFARTKPAPGDEAGFTKHKFSRFAIDRQCAVFLTYFQERL